MALRRIATEKSMLQVKVFHNLVVAWTVGARGPLYLRHSYFLFLLLSYPSLIRMFLHCYVNIEIFSCQLTQPRIRPLHHTRVALTTRKRRFACAKVFILSDSGYFQPKDFKLTRSSNSAIFMPFLCPVLWNMYINCKVIVRSL